MRTRKFWEDAGERVIRTMAQALLALMGTDALGIVGLDWAQMGSVAVGAGIMSLLTAIVATGIELVAPGSGAPGLPSSNNPMLGALLAPRPRVRAYLSRVREACGGPGHWDEVSSVLDRVVANLKKKEEKEEERRSGDSEGREQARL